MRAGSSGDRPARLAPLIDKNLYSGGNGSAIIHPPGRVAPYSTFVNTATLWALDPTDTTPPAPGVPVLDQPPSGSVAGSGASVHIPFSSSSDVTWQWSASAGKYLRYYSGSPDTLLDGSQTAATNVVVLTVPTADRPLGRELRGRSRGRRHPDRHRAPGGDAGRAGHRGHLEPVQPHLAGHPDRHRRDAHHPATRQHLGGAGAGRDPGHHGAARWRRRPRHPDHQAYG